MNTLAGWSWIARISCTAETSEKAGQQNYKIRLAFPETLPKLAVVLKAGHWICACWLALTVAATVGGWNIGRSQFVVKKPPGEETKAHLPRLNKSVVAVDSPQGQWAMRVKKATPAEFPRLLEEWKNLFSESENGAEGQSERALRWLLALWFTQDREGFVITVFNKDFKWSDQVALAIVRLNPEMISALRQLNIGMGGGDSRQREVRAEMIRSICYGYSVESCLSAAKLWAAELNGKRDDETFKSLAERSAAIDPDKVEAALDSLPESARAAFAAELVKRLPPEEPERRLALLGHLTPAQWDRNLGESLGKQGADFADAFFNLPATTTSEAQALFMIAWVDSDPEAAIKYFSALPQNDAMGPAAVGFYEGWAYLDSAAALAWAETLANGPVRQAVAPEVVEELAEHSPGEAWRWAASIADLEVRAMAYDTIASVHPLDAPEEFNKAKEMAARAAGFE